MWNSLLRSGAAYSIFRVSSAIGIHRGQVDSLCGNTVWQEPPNRDSGRRLPSTPIHSHPSGRSGLPFGQLQSHLKVVFPQLNRGPQALAHLFHSPQIVTVLMRIRSRQRINLFKRTPLFLDKPLHVGWQEFQRIFRGSHLASVLRLTELHQLSPIRNGHSDHCY